MIIKRTISGPFDRVPKTRLFLILRIQNISPPLPPPHLIAALALRHHFFVLVCRLAHACSSVARPLSTFWAAVPSRRNQISVGDPCSTGAPITNVRTMLEQSS